MGGTRQAAEGQRKLPVKAQKESKQPLPEQPWKRSRVIKRAHTTEGRREAARGWEGKREFSEGWFHFVRLVPKINLRTM